MKSDTDLTLKRTFFCKSLLCSMFNEQTCSRFTRLFVCSSPCPEYLIKPYNTIFFKCPGSKDIKTDIHNCQIHKYTNTALLKCQEYQTYAIFLNSCWFKDVKNNIPKCPIRHPIRQTCSRFTRLFVVVVTMPKISLKPYNAIFLKSPGSKDIKTDIPNCQIHKYTNTAYDKVPGIPNICGKDVIYSQDLGYSILGLRILNP